MIMKMNLYSAWELICPSNKCCHETKDCFPVSLLINLIIKLIFALEEKWQDTDISLLYFRTDIIYFLRHDDLNSQSLSPLSINKKLWLDIFIWTIRENNFTLITVISASKERFTWLFFLEISSFFLFFL